MEPEAAAPEVVTQVVERMAAADYRVTRLRLYEDAASATILQDCFSQNSALLSFSQDYLRFIGDRIDTENVPAECAVVYPSDGVERPLYYGGDSWYSDENSNSSRFGTPQGGFLGSADGHGAVAGGRNSYHTDTVQHGEPSTALTRPPPGGDVTHPHSPQQHHRCPRRNVNARTASGPSELRQPAACSGSTVGGIDIIDDGAYHERILLSLQVEALQSKQQQQRRAPTVGNELSLDDCSTVLDDTSVVSASVVTQHRHPVLSLSDALHILDCRQRYKVEGNHAGGSNADVAESAASTVPLSSVLSQTLSAESSATNDSCNHNIAFGGTTSPTTLSEHLWLTSGALLMKAPVTQCEVFMEDLRLTQLLHDEAAAAPTSTAARSPPSMAVASPLLLAPGTHFAWLSIGEQGSGTRTHVNVMGANAWFVLLRGSVRWLIAHPLDKHLLVHPVSGKPACLHTIDKVLYPAACHARISEVVLSPGEALFIPSEALHSSMCSEDSVGILMNFVDPSCALMNRRYRRYNEMLLQKGKHDYLLPEVHPLTTVDLVLFDDNVYPSFRGNARPYRPHSRQSYILLRGMAQFTQVKIPCSELGARIELEALQKCFSPLGQSLLAGDAGGAPHYVIGVPKGYRVSHKDDHLTLYYFVEPTSMAAVRACLAKESNRPRFRRFFQHYQCHNATLPPTQWFHSTSSHQGRIPNYVPLSVLLQQRWPFEGDLCERLVSLPRIILDKSYSPMGFLRTGSVWHYSRFALEGPEGAVKAPQTLLRGNWPAEDSSRCSCTDTPWLTTSFTSFLDARQLEDQPGEGWCRTFLFYCSPSLEQPLTMHPIRTHAHLQRSNGVLNCGSKAEEHHPGTNSAPFTPRIIEFEWNVSTLEEYGMVALIQMETQTSGIDALVQRLVVEHPSFPAFQQFVREHCMRPAELSSESSAENVMSSVLYFLCYPRVVGFTCGLRACNDVACVPVDEDDDPSGEWDSVCLTATAASALLVCVPNSTYARIATRLSNWLCDISSEATPEAEESLLSEVRRIMNSGDVEGQAIIHETARIKLEALQNSAKGGYDHEVYVNTNKVKIIEKIIASQQ